MTKACLWHFGRLFAAWVLGGVRAPDWGPGPADGDSFSARYYSPVYGDHDAIIQRERKARWKKRVWDVERLIFGQDLLDCVGENVDYGNESEFSSIDDEEDEELFLREEIEKTQIESGGNIKPGDRTHRRQNVGGKEEKKKRKKKFLGGTKTSSTKKQELEKKCAEFTVRRQRLRDDVLHLAVQQWNDLDTAKPLPIEKGQKIIKKNRRLDTHSSIMEQPQGTCVYENTDEFNPPLESMWSSQHAFESCAAVETEAEIYERNLQIKAEQRQKLFEKEENENRRKLAGHNPFLYQKLSMEDESKICKKPRNLHEEKYFVEEPIMASSSVMRNLNETISVNANVTEEAVISVPTATKNADGSYTLQLFESVQELRQPNFQRFERMGVGMCQDADFNTVSGFGASVETHDECRTTCMRANEGRGTTIVPICLGYSYYFCKKQCIVHLEPTKTHKVLNGWQPIAGSGTYITGTDGSCGPVCYRVTYGVCRAGEYSSTGAKVPYPEMVYGEERDEPCPAPFEGTITFGCRGLNRMLIGDELGLNRRCLKPCPPGEKVWRQGVEPLVWTENLQVNTARFGLPCPLSAHGSLSMRCLSDGTVFVDDADCGEDCRSGRYRLGMFLDEPSYIEHETMAHNDTRKFDCEDPKKPVKGYVGEQNLICENGVIKRTGGTTTSCSRHCLGTGVIELGMNATQAFYDVVAGLAGTISGTYPDDVLVEFKEENDPADAGDDETFTFMRHGSKIKVPCYPEDYAVGNVELECQDEKVVALSHDCILHCQPEEIDAGAGGFDYKMPMSSIVEHGETLLMECPEEDGWSGTIELSCERGVLTRARETDRCYRKCTDVQWLNNNGKSLYYETPLSIGHDAQMELDCSIPNPEFYTDPDDDSFILYHPETDYNGLFMANCTNGLLRFDKDCGVFCPPEIYNSNGANVATSRIEHQDIGSYECPAPYVGTLQLQCNDGILAPIFDEEQGRLSSCGRICPDQDFPVRGLAFAQVTQMDHGTTKEVPCPVNAQVNFEGSILLQCTDSVIEQIGGECMQRCLAGTITSNGYPVSYPLMPHNSTKYEDREDRYPCQNDIMLGYLDLYCNDGEVTILYGTCAAAPCRAGWFEGPQTNWVRLPYGRIGHQAFVTKDCPDPYTGTITLGCADTDVFVEESSCGSKCKANGTEPIYALIDQDGFEVLAGGEVDGFYRDPIYVELPEIFHLNTYTVDCPNDNAGNVTTICDDGYTRVYDGGCLRPCDQGTINFDNILMEVEYLKHGEISDLLECPVGDKSGGGELKVQCNNGTLVEHEGGCLKVCPAGELDAYGQDCSEDPKSCLVRHRSTQHQGEQSVTCPLDQGYGGRIVIQCFDGEMTTSGSCNLLCKGGRTVFSNEAVVRVVPQLTHEQEIVEECNADNPEHTGEITIFCDNGNLKIKEGEECKKSCKGFTILFGAQFAHGPMAHMARKQMACPGDGEIFVICQDGEVTVHSGVCKEQCLPGSLSDARDVIINWNMTIPHDTKVIAPCNTTQAFGNAVVYCVDGEATLDDSNCMPHCPADEWEQEGSFQQFRVDVVIPYDRFLHDSIQLLDCPSTWINRDGERADTNLRGIVQIQCFNGTIIYNPETDGQCGKNNCLAGRVEVGENLVMAYPLMNQGADHIAECNSAREPNNNNIYDGTVKFKCNDGVVETQRIWTSVPRLPLDPSTKDSEWIQPKPQPPLEEVNLCECCMQGRTAMAVGTGSVPPVQTTRTSPAALGLVLSVMGLASLALAVSYKYTIIKFFNPNYVPPHLRVESRIPKSNKFANDDLFGDLDMLDDAPGGDAFGDSLGDATMKAIEDGTGPPQDAVSPGQVYSSVVAPV